MLEFLSRLFKYKKRKNKERLAHKCGRLHMNCPSGNPNAECDVEALNEDHPGPHHCDSCNANFRA